MPPELRFESLAATLGTPFVDFNKNSTVLETLDESHLTPDPARQFALTLASEIQSYRFLTP